MSQIRPNSEGHSRIQHILLEDGRVTREHAKFLGASYVVLGAKVVADSVEEFKRHYPDAKIDNMVERPLAERLASLSDEQLESLGFARNATPAPAKKSAKKTAVAASEPVWNEGAEIDAA